MYQVCRVSPLVGSESAQEYISWGKVGEFSYCPAQSCLVSFHYRQLSLGCKAGKQNIAALIHMRTAIVFSCVH